jgi:tetratricopeptide (TPR) repeat protein
MMRLGMKVVWTIVILAVFSGVSLATLREGADAELGKANLATLRERANAELGKAEKLQADGRFVDAIKCLDYVIAEQEKALASQYEFRARCFYENGDYIKAEADYLKIATYRNDGYAEYKIGKCMIKRGEYAGAYDMFVKALKKQPDDADRHTQFMYKYHYTLAFFMVGDKSEAIKSFEALAEEYPEEDVVEAVRWAKLKQKKDREQSSGK